MRYLRWIFLILISLFVVILAVQNYPALSTSVQFKMYLIFDEFKTESMPLSLVVVIAFLVGVFITGVYGITERFRLTRQIKTLAKEAKARDKELNSLRNLPVSTQGANSGTSSDELLVPSGGISP